MDRIVVGAALAGISLLGTDVTPLLIQTETINYPVAYASKDACDKQLKYIAAKHGIKELTCVKHE